MQIIVNGLLSRIRKYNPELNEAQISSRRFGLEALINEMSKALFYLLIFAIFSLAAYYLLSLLIFCTIRLATGGYHAKSYLGCLIVSLIVFVVTVFSGQYMDLTILERSTILIISFIITIIFAPVKHKNTTRKNIAKAQRFKFLSIILIIFWCSSTYLLPGAWGVTAVITIFIEALMQPLGRIFNPSMNSESRG